MVSDSHSLASGQESLLGIIKGLGLEEQTSHQAATCPVPLEKKGPWGTYPAAKGVTMKIQACQVIKNPNGNPLPCSCLGNGIDRGAWRATVLGVARVNTPEQLSKHTHMAVRGQNLQRRWMATPKDTRRIRTAATSRPMMSGVQDRPGKYTRAE